MCHKFLPLFCLHWHKFLRHVTSRLWRVYNENMCGPIRTRKCRSTGWLINYMCIVIPKLHCWSALCCVMVLNWKQLSSKLIWLTLKFNIDKKFEIDKITWPTSASWKSFFKIQLGNIFSCAGILAFSSQDDFKRNQKKSKKDKLERNITMLLSGFVTTKYKFIDPFVQSYITNINS